jgi:hypothetical protein
MNPQPQPKAAYQLHRRHAPATSILAAEHVASALGPRQLLVLDWFRAHGPATSEQMELALMMHYGPNTTRPRISELRDMGLLRVCGRGVTRTGSAANVWDAVPPEPVVLPLFPLIRHLERGEDMAAVDSVTFTGRGRSVELRAPDDDERTDHATFEERYDDACERYNVALTALVQAKEGAKDAKNEVDDALHSLRSLRARQQDKLPGY